MEKQTLIQLTNEVYRVTLLFPKKEPLRYKIRAIAGDILEACLKGADEKNEAINSINILESFFEVAQEQHWVKQELILNIVQEYGILKQELEGVGKDKEDKTDSVPGFAFFSPNEQKQNTVVGSKKSNQERQGKILDLVKTRGKIQVWEVKQVMPGVSKRTLRRDFEHLFKQGLVQRVGEKNQTFYQPSI